MRSVSLSNRLLLVAGVWSFVVLISAGAILSQVYRTSVERSFDERLHVYLKALVAAVSGAPEDGDFAPGNFGEPRFDLPLSGWYWQIRPVGDRRGETLTSPSLFEQTLPQFGEAGSDARSFTRDGYVSGPGGQRLRMIERRIDFGSGATYAMAVAGDADVIDSEIRNFVRTLAVALGVLGIGVLISVILQVTWSLSPLRRIERALAAVRSGRVHRLEGVFPREIQPLADEINALIRANQEVVERARTHVGNLAHALKTPLSVVTNEARPQRSAFARKVEEQAELMRAQISHHLQRARAAARVSVATEVTDVGPVIGGLQRAMERIYRDRRIAVHVRVPAELRFRGERQDLEEMVGNLVDNACKWAGRRVEVEASPEPGGADGHQLRLLVDDDGPGMAPEDRQEALRRGERLDESKPGSGLGLSIVADLAKLYGGRLALSAAPQGGLRAELLLPAA